MILKIFCPSVFRLGYKRRKCNNLKNVVEGFVIFVDLHFFAFLLFVLFNFHVHLSFLRASLHMDDVIIAKLYQHILKIQGHTCIF